MSGVPFLDEASTPECDNLIIYGHNMKNGTMFSDITQYRNKAYCEEHPYIEFETADGLKVYQVFAVVCLKKTDLWYNISCFESEEHYQKAITEIKDRSLDYTRQVFDMYDGTKEKVTLLCKNELMNYIVDKFGDEVETSPTDNSHFKAVVEVSVSQTFFAWVFQFNGDIIITNPSAVVSRYREMLENALK